MRLRVPSAILAVLVLAAAACGTSTSVSVQRPRPSPTPDPAVVAYVDLIRGYWAQLHAADLAPDGSDADGAACLGEVSSTSHSDVKVVEPSVCRTYAVATRAANQRFLAELGQTQAPTKFATDDQVFRLGIPQAIDDLTALIAACDAANRPVIIANMWAYAHDMIPDVTDALDDVDASITHQDPSRPLS